MNTDLSLVLLLLAAAVAMFVANRPRMDAVALIMITVMPLTGIITMPEALAGFSDSSIVLIAALFVIGEGLVRTGVARRLGDWLNRKAGGSETRLPVLLMLSVAGLGAHELDRLRRDLHPGGPAHLSEHRHRAEPADDAAERRGADQRHTDPGATAPDLVVHAELVRQGAGGFHFFSFTPFGIPVLALGILYMLAARRLLAARGGGTASGRSRPSLRDWIDQYALTDRTYRVRVPAASPLAGRRLEELSLRASGVNLLAIERSGRFAGDVIRPTARTELQAGDILLLDVRAQDTEIEALRRKYGVEELPLGDARTFFADRSQALGMVEAIVPPESALIGWSVLEAGVRAQSGLTVIGLRRGREVFGRGLLEERLRAGDTLLLTGFWSDIRKYLADTHELIPLGLPAEMDEVLPAADKAPHALAALALVVALMVGGVVPNVQAALIGCLLMGLFGCVDMTSRSRWSSSSSACSSCRGCYCYGNG